jgi:hypothetical protein
MARTKKTVESPKVDNVKTITLNEGQPIITCITINPNGTIFGLADNKIYVYDDFKHEWKAL